MRRYENMKYTGVEWIEEVPEHWELFRLKNICDIKPSNVDKHIYDTEKKVKLCNYTDVYYNEYITNNIPFSSGTASVSEIAKFSLEKDDIIVTKDSESADDIGVPAFVPEDLKNVVCAYHLTLIRVKKIIFIGEFLFRYIQSNGVRMHFEVESNGITRFGLGKSTIENLLVVLPPIYEQRQIVSFLDEKTSKIDSLIEKKQRKIELLREKRKALIHHAVTKGLNPDAPMKDSGVEWIGEIPKKWHVSTIRYYLNKVGSGVTPRGGSETYVEEGIPLIRSQNVHFDGLRLDDVAYITNTVHQGMKNSVVREGDVLLNITGASIGRCCYVDCSSELNVNQHVCIIRTKPSLYAKYLNYFIQSKIGQLQVELRMSGANREGLTVDGIKNFVVPFSDISEQKVIVKYLDEITREIDELITKEQQKIDLLKEYRLSLIFEAVTGKIDVREEVPA